MSEKNIVDNPNLTKEQTDRLPGVVKGFAEAHDNEAMGYLERLEQRRKAANREITKIDTAAKGYEFLHDKSEPITREENRKKIQEYKWAEVSKFYQENKPHLDTLIGILEDIEITLLDKPIPADQQLNINQWQYEKGTAHKNVQNPLASIIAALGDTDYLKAHVTKTSSGKPDREIVIEPVQYKHTQNGWKTIADYETSTSVRLSIEPLVERLTSYRKMMNALTSDNPVVAINENNDNHPYILTELSQSQRLLEGLVKTVQFNNAMLENITADKLQKALTATHSLKENALSNRIDIEQKRVVERIKGSERHLGPHESEESVVRNDQFVISGSKASNPPNLVAALLDSPPDREMVQNAKNMGDFMTKIAKEKHAKTMAASNGMSV